MGSVIGAGQLAIDSGKKAAMRYKPIAFVLLTLVLTSAHFAQAQQPKKTFRVAYVTGSSPSTVAVRTEAFRQGLRELGYIERKNIAIEYRYAEGS